MIVLHIDLLISLELADVATFAELMRGYPANLRCLSV